MIPADPDCPAVAVTGDTRWPAPGAPEAGHGREDVGPQIRVAAYRIRAGVPRRHRRGQIRGQLRGVVAGPGAGRGERL